MFKIHNFRIVWSHLFFFLLQIASIPSILSEFIQQTRTVGHWDNEKLHLVRMIEKGKKGEKKSSEFLAFAFAVFFQYIFVSGKLLEKMRKKDEKKSFLHSQKWISLSLAFFYVSEFF